MKERERLVVGGLVALLLVLWLGFLVHRDPRFAGSAWGGVLAVTAHQQVFFHTTWAKFDEAVPGTLRLVPPESRMKEIERDYEEMRREMIFGDAPKLSELVEVLTEIERQVNTAK